VEEEVCDIVSDLRLRWIFSVVASLILRVASVETDEASNESVIVTSRRTEFIIFVETEPER